MGDLRDDPLTCELIDEAASILRNHLSANPTHCGRFNGSIAPATGYTLYWQQPHPTCAMAVMGWHDLLLFYALLLYGGEPVTNAIAVKALSETMAAWVERYGPAVSRAFNNIRQRPIVITVPLLPQTAKERKLYTLFVACIATAFFERVAEFMGDMDVLWFEERERIRDDIRRRNAPQMN